MFRRLNYLLPSARSAQTIVNELLDMGINEKQIHAYAEHGLSTQALPLASKNMAEDRASKLEKIFWRGNLVLFFICMTIFIMTLLTANYLIALACLGVMIVSFSAGNFFASHIPQVHLSQLKDALSHNELLLMVDVPDEKVTAVEYKVHRYHPDAIEAGSSWALKGVDI